MELLYLDRLLTGWESKSRLVAVGLNDALPRDPIGSGMDRDDMSSGRDELPLRSLGENDGQGVCSLRTGPRTLRKARASGNGAPGPVHRQERADDGYHQNDLDVDYQLGM